ncbi:uncharacterized protein ATC70_012581 [Mucor velutinosus]|uniref:Striatin N-terminal domain-containing protein n=1 Tax=Mucor velutinosus TaxID=708070 RepID=A0AAN7D5M3_9FUNG|nr:hypothetical protein ATC70_012581 [Mucor velutinosus]
MSDQSTEYTLPGVLHYLQAEWRKFEREKNEWMIERAELKARIALLEGERRGVENIKLTLMKRVKMLEYALRQERKRHASVTTTNTSDDPPATTITTTTNPTTTDNNIPSTISTTMPPVASATTTTAAASSPSAPAFTDNKLKEKSREVLKSCLQEINYLTSFPSKLPLTNALTSRSPNSSNERSSSIRRAPPPPSNSSNQNSPVLSAAGSRTQQRSESKSSSPLMSQYKHNSKSNGSSPIPKKSTLSQRDDVDVEVPANVDEVAMINNIKEEKEHYSASQDSKALSQQIQEKFHLSEEKVMKLLRYASKGGQNKVDHERLLAGDFDPNQIGDIDSHQQLQPKIWKPRVTIKGHLDSIRAVGFHPNEMIAASGSDDGTVKIWNLQRATGKDGNATKKGSHEEADPSITFRGHTNVVTSVAISASQNRVYSASLDSTIRVWNLPKEDRGPFSPVDPSLNVATYVGHTDAIWDFKLSPDNYDDNLLASASADGTIKLWDTQTSGNLLKTSWAFDGISKEEDSRKNRVAPTSLDFCQTDVNKIVVSFANAKIRLYDIETGQVILTFKGSDDSYDNTFATQINRIISHPTMSLIVSGHEDRHIRFYDLKSGECTQSVSGHLDAVTSLHIDSTGKTMASGGHDSSIRLWNIASKSCIQEFSAHRKKGDEGVLDIKFHKSFPWMISGGADGIVKVYHRGY